MEIAFVNGDFLPINEKVIPIDERGHQFGDGVYEVIRVYNRIPFLLDDHLDRLMVSANAIKIKLTHTHTKEELQQIILEGIRRAQIDEAEVYLQVTRGIARRNHLFPDVDPSISMTVREARIAPDERYLNGASVTIMEDERWTNCYIKSLNLLPNILSKQEAASKGFHEAVYEKDGKVTEGSSSNVFVIKSGVLYTTPLSKKILAGITRKTVLHVASTLHLPVVEVDMSIQFLKEADEAFFTSTSMEVMPIRDIDGTKVGNGVPGIWTKKLLEGYRKLIK